MSEQGLSRSRAALDLNLEQESDQELAQKLEQMLG
jgi:hypothetical protein